MARIIPLRMRRCSSSALRLAHGAARAGIGAWIAFSVPGPAQCTPLGFFAQALWIKAGAFQHVTSIVAAIAGAALYRD